ncbi:hypothetical protein [Mesorhizobium sp.]|uniref:hypothetical protein n=1 Tax=Mesorhizobium sp. TaxID=1871066 RepID=UPI003BA85F14
MAELPEIGIVTYVKAKDRSKQAIGFPAKATRRPSCTLVQVSTSLPEPAMKNDANPDLSSVTRLPPANISTGEDDLDFARIEARQYLEFYNWVCTIKGEYLGYGAEGIIYIFLFEISPRQTGCPKWIWLIVGDVPSAFIPGDGATTPYEALDEYIGAMEEWVKAARRGKSVAKLIPVNVDANPANAEMLDGRSNSSMKRSCRYFDGNSANCAHID